MSRPDFRIRPHVHAKVSPVQGRASQMFDLSARVLQQGDAQVSRPEAQRGEALLLLAVRQDLSSSFDARASRADPRRGQSVHVSRVRSGLHLEVQHGEAREKISPRVNIQYFLHTNSALMWSLNILRDILVK